MIGHEKPADPVGTDGLSSMVSRGSRHPETTANGPETQVPWAIARDLERRSNQCGRSALTMRGADRFHALALASTFALAARDAALSAGVAQ